MTATPDPKMMLYLAALTYARFSDVNPAAIHRDNLAAAIERGLATDLARGQWELVWGPESYRAPVSLFDDAAMYVLRSTAEAPRYVVAIRGTSPVSAFDWIFGDLWVSRLMPWPYGGSRPASAAISLSTALGLSILQNLRSIGPVASSPLGRLIEDRARAVAERVTALLLQRLRGVLDQIAPIRNGLWAELTRLEQKRKSFATAQSQVENLIDEWTSDRRQTLLKFFLDAENPLRALGDQAHLGLFALLEKEIDLQTRLASGHDLLSFLRGAVAHADGKPVDVIVTGHSKGGALATAVAQWLHDTRGATVSEDQRWDSDGQATVQCFSFAGPTAGNKDFGEHCQAQMKTNYHRCTNALDVVPCGFVPDKIRRVADLYGADVIPLPALKELAETIATAVTPLQYTHVYPLAGAQFTELEGKVQPSKHTFVDQAIYQHLDGYLSAMGFGPTMNTWTFFNPLT